MKRFGTVLFYFGGFVWVAYAVAKYMLGWDVTLRQFLPYHLAAVIPGMLLKHGGGVYALLMGARDRKPPAGNDLS